MSVRLAAALSALLFAPAALAASGTTLAVVNDRDMGSFTFVRLDGTRAVEHRSVTESGLLTPLVTADGSVAAAYDPARGRWHVLEPDGPHEIVSDEQPTAAAGWVSSGRRLVQPQPATRSLVLDLTAGGVARGSVSLPMRACTRPMDGEVVAYCVALSGGGAWTVDARSGDVLDEMLTGGDEIEWGTDGDLVLRRGMTVAAVDRTGRPRREIRFPDVLGISTDPASRLLLVHLDYERVELFALDTFVRLAEVRVDRSMGPATRVELLEGGAGFAVQHPEDVTIQTVRGTLVDTMQGERFAIGRWWAPDVRLTINGGATQSSVDAIQADVDARLDVAVSTRASQSSVDALAATTATRASQASVDALAGTTATRASQSSVDALAATTATRASQSSLDALAAVADDVAADVDGVATGVDDVASQVGDVDADLDSVAAGVSETLSRLDVASSTRASQSSVDALAATLGGVDARTDVPASTRASQASLDALAAELASSTARAEEAHASLLEALGVGARRGIEASLLAGHLEPMFLVPAGPDADPARDGVTCPTLPAAGHAAVQADGLFEAVRCVTGRAITALQAIGETSRTAERKFADAEAARLQSPPDHRAAVEAYAAALEALARGR